MNKERKIVYSLVYSLQEQLSFYSQLGNCKNSYFTSLNVESYNTFPSLQEVLLASLKTIKENHLDNADQYIFIIGKENADDFSKQAYEITDVFNKLFINGNFIIYFEDVDIKYLYSSDNLNIHECGFNKEQLLAIRFGMDFKERFMIKTTEMNFNYYFYGSKKYNVALLKHFLCDTLFPIRNEQFFIIDDDVKEPLKKSVKQLNKMKKLFDFSINCYPENINKFFFSPNDYIFVNASHKQNVELVNNLLEKNPSSHIFVINDELFENNNKNVESILFKNYFDKMFYDEDLIDQINVTCTHLDVCNEELEDFSFPLHLEHNENCLAVSMYDETYLYATLLYNAVVLTNRDIRIANMSLAVKMRLLKDYFKDIKENYIFPARLYEAIKMKYIFDNPLMRLANLEHIRWMIRTIIYFDDFKDKQKYYVSLKSMLDNFNKKNMLSDAKEAFDEDIILPDYVNVLSIMRYFLEIKYK